MSPIKRRQLLKATLTTSALVISNTNAGFAKAAGSFKMEEDVLLIPSAPAPSRPPSPASASSSSAGGSDFAQEQILNNQVQLKAPSAPSSVNVIPGGASVGANKSYEIVLVFQNISPVAAPQVLASLVLPTGLSFISAKWEKEGAWYSDGNLPRTGSFDGKKVTYAIGELWSGMKATITLRVSAIPSQYRLDVKVEDLSAVYEVDTDNRSIITLTLN